VVFGGQRWVILDIDERTNTLLVHLIPAARYPSSMVPAANAFMTDWWRRLRVVFESSDAPGYLDKAR